MTENTNANPIDKSQLDNAQSDVANEARLRSLLSRFFTG